MLLLLAPEPERLVRVGGGGGTGSGGEGWGGGAGGFCHFGWDDGVLGATGVDVISDLWIAWQTIYGGG